MTKKTFRGKSGDLGYSFYLNKTLTTPYYQTETGDVYAKTATAKSKPSSYPSTQNASLASKLKDSYANDVTYKEESDVTTYGGRLEYDLTRDIKAGLEFNRFFEEREGSYIGYFHPTNFNLGASKNKIAAYNVPVNSKDVNDRLDLSADVAAKISKDLTLKARAYRSLYEKRNKTSAKNWADMGYSSEESSIQNGMDANVDVRALELSAVYAVASHLLSGGYEYRDENREASVFTQANDLTKKSVSYKAVYLQDEWDMGGGFSSIIGARYDDISNADDKATFKLGVVKKISEALSLRGSFAQGYRAPDLRELYIYKQTATGINRGSATIDTALGKKEYDLKPESTNSFEAGLSGAYGAFDYDAAFFYNDIKDMIAEINKGSYYTFENLSSAKTYGAEINARYKINDETSIKLGWSELATKNDDNDKELEFNPDRIVSLKIAYSPIKSLTLSAGAKYVGEQFFRDTINRGALSETIVDAKTSSYITADIAANYDYSKNISFYAGMNNILDKKIDDVLGSSSGIYFYSGIKARF